MDEGAIALMIVFILLAVAGFAVWIWALVDVVRVHDESMFRAGNKLIWVLVVVLAGFVGAIVYLVVGRPAASAQRPPGGWVPPPPPGSLG
jgi:heme/copper-type cytochrome/quinol oxidase subunit 3